MTIPLVLSGMICTFELWEGNYLTKTAQVNLTWDAVAAKIADLIEQGRLMVPHQGYTVLQQMEQLTLTPKILKRQGCRAMSSKQKYRPCGRSQKVEQAHH